MAAPTRTSRALVTLYALLCLLAGGLVPSLHAAAEGPAESGWSAAEGDRRAPEDAPSPEPHDHQHCVLCHAGASTPALPEGSALHFAPREVSASVPAPRPASRRLDPVAVLPPSRAPPRA